MTERTNNKDFVIAEALKLLDEGVSPTEILRRFPREKKMLEEAFLTMRTLNSLKDGILAPQAVFQKILERSPHVTAGPASRYVRHREETGRFPKIIHTIIEFVSSRWAVVPVGALIVLLVIFAARPRRGGEEPKAADESRQSIESFTLTVPASGSPDDFVSLLLADAAAEADLSRSEVGDEALLANDANELDSYQIDETQF